MSKRRAVFAFMLALVLPRAAQANGRLPGANQLVFSPTDPNIAILRSTFGLLITKDGGTTWDWICEPALPNLPSAFDPALGITANGTVLATALPGLDVSNDMACSWATTPCPFGVLDVIDVAVRPDAPQIAFVLASTSDRALVYNPDSCADAEAPEAGGAADASGGFTFETQVFVTKDNGVSWSAVGPRIDPTLIVTTIDVAASDSNRLYISGFRDPSTSNAAVMLTSIDGGSHFDAHSIDLKAPDESALYIAAVDPTNADRVYLRTGSISKRPARLLVTSDRGASFQTALTLQDQMLGFALASDGKTIFAGSPTDGLFKADRDGLSFQKQSNIAVSCLASHGADVWACSNEVSGFIAGVSNDMGATFTPKLHMCSIRAPLACGSGASVARECTADAFDILRKGLGCQNPGEDAGASDAADAGPASNPSPPRSSCGCRTIARDSGEWGPEEPWLAGCALALAFGAMRRRRAGLPHESHGETQKKASLPNLDSNK